LISSGSYPPKILLNNKPLNSEKQSSINFIRSPHEEKPDSSHSSNKPSLFNRNPREYSQNDEFFKMRNNHSYSSQEEKGKVFEGKNNKEDSRFYSRSRLDDDTMQFKDVEEVSLTKKSYRLED
jgi:hypothetical protein